MKVKVEDITIDFECSECKLTVDVPVSEVIAMGPPLCTICKDNPEMFYTEATINWQ